MKLANERQESITWLFSRANKLLEETNSIQQRFSKYSNEVDLLILKIQKESEGIK